MSDERDSLLCLKRDFGAWLAGPDFDWSHFCTFTFSKFPGAHAIKHADLFLQSLATDLERAPIVGFVCTEKGAVGGREHLHGLLSLRGVASSTIGDAWRNRYGFARVGPYNPQMGGIKYVTKYVLKDACAAADWRLYPTLESGPDEDLFRASSRLTGYQLYTRWLAEIDRSEAS